MGTSIQQYQYGIAETVRTDVQLQQTFLGNTKWFEFFFFFGCILTCSSVKNFLYLTYNYRDFMKTVLWKIYSRKRKNPQTQRGSISKIQYHISKHCWHRAVDQITSTGMANPTSAWKPEVLWPKPYWLEVNCKPPGSFLFQDEALQGKEISISEAIFGSTWCLKG